MGYAPLAPAAIRQDQQRRKASSYEPALFPEDTPLVVPVRMPHVVAFTKAFRARRHAESRRRSSFLRDGMGLIAVERQTGRC